MSLEFVELQEEELIDGSFNEAGLVIEKTQAEELLEGMELEPAEAKAEQTEARPDDVIAEYGEGKWEKTFDEQITGRFDAARGEMLSVDGRESYTEQIRQTENALYVAAHEQIIDAWRRSGGDPQLVSYKEEVEGGTMLHVTRTWVEDDWRIVSETWSRLLENEEQKIEESENYEDVVLQEFFPQELQEEIIRNETAEVESLTVHAAEAKESTVAYSDIKKEIGQREEPRSISRDIELVETVGIKKEAPVDVKEVVFFDEQAIELPHVSSESKIIPQGETNAEQTEESHQLVKEHEFVPTEDPAKEIEPNETAQLLTVEQRRELEVLGITLIEEQEEIKNESRNSLQELSFETPVLEVKQFIEQSSHNETYEAPAISLVEISDSEELPELIIERPELTEEAKEVPSPLVVEATIQPEIYSETVFISEIAEDTNEKNIFEEPAIEIVEDFEVIKTEDTKTTETVGTISRDIGKDSVIESKQETVMEFKEIKEEIRENIKEEIIKEKQAESQVVKEEAKVNQAIEKNEIIVQKNIQSPEKISAELKIEEQNTIEAEVPTERYEQAVEVYTRMEAPVIMKMNEPIVLFREQLEVVEKVEIKESAPEKLTADTMRSEVEEISVENKQTESVNNIFVTAANEQSSPIHLEQVVAQSTSPEELLRRVFGFKQDLSSDDEAATVETQNNQVEFKLAA